MISRPGIFNVEHKVVNDVVRNITKVAVKITAKVDLVKDITKVVVKIVSKVIVKNFTIVGFLNAQTLRIPSRRLSPALPKSLSRTWLRSGLGLHLG